MKLEIKEKMLNLLGDGNFLALEKIVDSLNISRSTIFKQIKFLKESGYNIEFVKNKGYRLVSKPDMLIPEEIKAEINTDIIGKDVFCFKSISSTNTYAKEIAENGVKEGAVVIAEIQTHGRGRKNKIWLSPFGGLWLSLVLRPKISAERGMFVTMLVSVAVSQAIKEVTGLEPVIKWPNDVLINKKKVCGILTEFDTKGNIINYAVVGIGINVNNKINDDIKEIATSLSIEFGSNIPRLKFLKSVIKYIDNNYKKLIKGDFSTIKKLWMSYSKIIGKKVNIKDNGNTISGKIYAIDDNGFLLLKTKEGIHEILNGDVFIYG